MQLPSPIITVICVFIYPGIYMLSVTILWFSPGTPVSATNKTNRHDITDSHDITEIVLKVALKTINQTYTIILWVWRFNFKSTLRKSHVIVQKVHRCPRNWKFTAIQPRPLFTNFIKTNYWVNNISWNCGILREIRVILIIYILMV